MRRFLTFESNFWIREGSSVAFSVFLFPFGRKGFNEKNGKMKRNTGREKGESIERSYRASRIFQLETEGVGHGQSMTKGCRNHPLRYAGSCVGAWTHERVRMRHLNECICRSNPVDPRVLRSRGGNSTPVNCYGGARRPRGLLASRAAGVVETSQRCRIGDEYDQKENSKEARRVPSRNRVSFLLEIWCSLVNLGRRVSKEFAK